MSKICIAWLITSHNQGEQIFDKRGKPDLSFEAVCRKQIASNGRTRPKMVCKITK